MSKEQIRKEISKYLINTDEQHPIPLVDILLESEAQGLSTLEMPTVESIFQIPGEGIIYVNIEYCDEPIEIEDLSKEDMQKILDYLDNYYNY